MFFMSKQVSLPKSRARCTATKKIGPKSDIHSFGRKSFTYKDLKTMWYKIATKTIFVFLNNKIAANISLLASLTALLWFS